MKRNYDYVNVFQGSGAIDLPEPEGIAATWLFIKAQCGNTTPAAAYPFGKTTVCAYTGGYPTGYDNRLPNSCGRAQTTPVTAHGFSHMHVSGTGAIRTYYNYAIVTPHTSGLLEPISEDIVKEDARPGYYSATLSGGARFEGTVSKKIALHRYELGGDGLISVDFSNDGLLRFEDEFSKRFYGYPAFAEIKALSPTRVTARCILQGVDLYFAVECREAQDVFLWENYERTEGSILVPSDLKNRFGAAFKVPSKAEVRVAISFNGCDAALAMLDEETRGFDTVLSDTARVWSEQLERIRIATEDERLKEIFYSNLYHTLIKPNTGAGESFRYDMKGKDGKFCFDLSTLWDIYKTCLPFLFTLYPEISEEIVETLLNIIESEGHSPITVTVAKGSDDSVQARMLAEHAFADYYFRYGKQGERMLDAAERDLESNPDFLESGYCERYTHIVDICEALGAMAEVADELGDTKRKEKFAKYADLWKNAYDKETGLLSTRSRYYEGDNYNYSFRLLRNMEERIALCGKEKFLSDLDELFGYTREPVEMPTEPEVDPLERGIHSFEGFNNESDMEAPYAYIFAGRQDKTCEIVSAGHEYMFTTGRGGIPGNNDSGGLSSCYIWNMLGIFPVAGQDLMLLGSPKIKGAALSLGNGRELVIEVHGKGIYLDRATINGKKIENFRFTVREMMEGGKLEMFMKSESKGD